MKYFLKTNLCRLLCMGALLLLLPLRSFSHAPDQSYTFMLIYEEEVGGYFEMTLKDLGQALGMNLKKGMTIDEVTPFLPRIKEYVLGKVAFSSDTGTHPLRFEEERINDRGDLGDYLQLNFVLDGVKEVPEALEIRNEILLDPSTDHRHLLVVEYNWKAGIHNNEAMVSLIFSPDETTQNLSLTDASILKGFITMVKSGMWHIYIGLDHILFLLALVLPSVVRRRSSEPERQNIMAASGGYWEPVEKFKPAFIYIIKVVTFFTIAHTITLSLAALQVVELPSRIVESIIALSIALAALHNIRPLFKNDEMIIAFGFGLFHGFGFASVLGEIGLRGEFMTLSLFGFNLGVEIGQILIISLIFPVLYLIRTLKFYPRFLVYASVLLILISMYWFTERFFELDLPLGYYVNYAYAKGMQLLGLS